MLKILVDLIPKFSSFSVLKMVTITKWRNAKDWIDTEKYPHHKIRYTVKPSVYEPGFFNLALTGFYINGT